MKLFGNSRRRTPAPRQRPEKERSIPAREERYTPAPREKKKGPEKESYNPRRALILFVISVAIFVAVTVMCLTLIERSGESSFKPTEYEPKELEYVVGGEPGQPTESTEPTENSREATEPSGNG